MARRIHFVSDRRDRALISINCAAIPDALVESELFGFEQGAFTGAVSRRDGKLVQAHGGTLFLDEIGDLSISAQAKLLRFLEQKEVQPLGSRKSTTIDVRVVAATSRNLEELAKLDKFRLDLFFRLSVIHVHVPPLRERREDIPLIANHLLRALSIQYGRPPIDLTPGAQACLKEQPWIGNARELRNVLERAFLFANSEHITERDIFDHCRPAMRWTVGMAPQASGSFQVRATAQTGHRTSTAGMKHHEVRSSHTSDLEQLRWALEETRWNKSKTARLLQCSRMTIYRRVARYDLRPPTGSSENPMWPRPGVCS